MRILLLGAYGLIGSAALGHMLAAGHQVTGLGRRVEAARRRWPEADWVAADIAGLATPAAWRPLLDGMNAVVNCADALQNGARDDVQALQSIAMHALFDACAEAGIDRIVQVSAIGACADAPTAFMRSKADADAALIDRPGGWVILRPGLVLGPQAYGGTALLRAMASLPGLLAVARGEVRIQTVHVEDVADAVLAAVEARVPPRTSYDLVEAESHSLETVLLALRTWLGWPATRVVRLPESLGRLAFRIGDALGHLAWRSPMRSTAWAELGRGIAGDPTPWAAATGRPMRSLAQSLRAMPATVQERWFGRLWLLKPLVLGVLAVFWMLSGALGRARFGAAQDVLTQRGVAPDLAAVAVALGAAIDLLLGLLVLIRRWMPVAALGMVLVSTGYLAAGSLVAPDLWLDPLGPFVKVVPAAVLALVALAVAEER